MFPQSIKYNILAKFVTNCYLIKRRFRDSKIVFITNFVVVSSVGIKSVVCTHF